jgi:hypothetical protein
MSTEILPFDGYTIRIKTEMRNGMFERGIKITFEKYNIDTAERAAEYLKTKYELGYDDCLTAFKSYFLKKKLDKLINE